MRANRNLGWEPAAGRAIFDIAAATVVDLYLATNTAVVTLIGTEGFSLCLS
jgi:hypothetical protein